MDAHLNPKQPQIRASKSVERPTLAQAEQAVRTLIAWAGDDPSREGMLDTPKRVLSAYDELFAGYHADPKEILSKTFKDVGGYDDIVLVRDIPFYSHCEHHMVPFFGKAHIAYLPSGGPDGGVVGLSKLARIVNAFSQRFQTQENLTAQIIDAINDHLEPRGAAILVDAEHMCMSMRGVKTPQARTTTHKFTGSFAEDRAEQDRFFAMLQTG